MEGGNAVLGCVLVNRGLLRGGPGGGGWDILDTGIFHSDGYSGSGGRGVAGNVSTNLGEIVGGSGGVGGRGDDTCGGNGGEGGIGVSGDVMLNVGKISGGIGGDSGPDTTGTGIPGSGGVGVCGLIVVNEGKVFGGNSGVLGGGSRSSIYGDPNSISGGVAVVGAVSMNKGLILGGDYLQLDLHPYDSDKCGNGGVGVVGTVESNACVISGGRNLDGGIDGPPVLGKVVDETGIELTGRWIDELTLSSQWYTGEYQTYTSDVPCKVVCALKESQSGKDVGCYDCTINVVRYEDYLTFPNEETEIGLKWSIVAAKIADGGSEPGQGGVPEGGISKFDGKYAYDGEGHTINTQALYAVKLPGSTPTFGFSLSENGVFKQEPPVYTNIGEYVIWYQISAPNYETFKHQAKVTIYSDHEHDGVLFDRMIPAGFTGGEIEPGNYFLAADIKLSKGIEVKGNGDFRLCLNGHVIDGGDGYFSGIHYLYNVSIHDCGNTEHRFKVTESGRWKLDKNGDKIVRGGVITACRGHWFSGSDYSGGGIMTGCDFSLYGGNIVGNGEDYASKGHGGGVYCQGRARLLGGAILGNVKHSGGGVCCAELRMIDCYIAHNRAEGLGGGIWVAGTPENGWSEMSGGVITENYADNSGGGIHCTSFNYDRPLIVSGGSISNNIAKLTGGAIATFDEVDIVIHGGCIKGNNVLEHCHTMRDNVELITVNDRARLTLSGNAQIDDCIFLCHDNLSRVNNRIIIDGALSNDVPYRIAMDREPTGNAGVPFTELCSTNWSDKFVSADPNYLVRNVGSGDSQYLELAFATPAEPVVLSVSGDECIYGAKASVSVSATAETGNTLSYQWYECDEGGEIVKPVAGATSATSQVADLLDVGSHFYRCMVTATSTASGLSASATSDMATVVVSKRNVTLTSGSDSKKFDNTPLTMHSFTVGGDGFVAGQGVTCSYTGSQTLVGDSKNTFTYTVNPGTKESNYQITQIEGTLTVAKSQMGGGGEEPGSGTVPEGGLSKFDFTGEYNGKGQTIDLDKLMTAFAPYTVGEEDPVRFATSSEGPWSEVAPTITDVGELVVWYKVMSPNYEDYVHQAKVTVVEKVITDEMVQPGEDAFFFDGDDKKPTVDVQYFVDGKDICTENDYTLTYGTKAGAGWWVTVTGKGNYSGTVTKIVPVLKHPVAPPIVPSRSYNGKAQKPTIPTDSRWTVVANPGGINVGEYANVVLRLTNTTDYKWKGGAEDQTDITLVFKVTKGNNGWSRQPDMKGWAYGETPSEPSMGQARYGTVKVAYRKSGADVSTETATRPELPGKYLARFWVDETENFIGVAVHEPYKDIAFEITGSGPEPSGDVTETTPVPVPHDWLNAYVTEFGGGDYETAANAKGRNGVSLWESYVAGLDPTDVTSQFKASITMGVDGSPVITWEPDLRDANPPRVYVEYGKANLGDKDWTSVTDANRAAMRFFKVGVEIK